MLQVVKVGATVSGKHLSRHKDGSASNSTSGDEFSSPNGILTDATLSRSQFVSSSLTSPCATMCVVASNVICKDRITITSPNGSSLVSSSRSGNGSLGTRIGGDGSRASIINRTGIGSTRETGSGFRKELNSPLDFVADLGTTINSCFRLAKVSAVVGGGRGGSIGRKTNGSVCRMFVL
jgi:hypothetical protein